MPICRNSLMPRQDRYPRPDFPRPDLARRCAVAADTTGPLEITARPPIQWGAAAPGWVPRNAREKRRHDERWLSLNRADTGQVLAVFPPTYRITAD